MISHQQGMSDSPPLPMLIPSTLALVLDHRTVDYAQVAADLDRAEAKLAAIKEELGIKNYEEAGGA